MGRYAGVEDVIAVLGIRPQDVDAAAVDQVLRATEDEMDHVLDRGTDPLPTPAPAGVSQAVTQVAADVYAAQTTRYGILDPGSPDLPAVSVARDPWRITEHLWAPWAKAHGIS